MNLDPGGIVGLLLCLGLVTVIAFVTRRRGGRRRPAGAPIHRSNPSYGRRLRREADDSDWGSSGDSGDSGGSCGSSCGGGGGGGD